MNEIETQACGLCGEPVKSGHGNHPKCAVLNNALRVNAAMTPKRPSPNMERATFDWFFSALAETRNVCPICRWEFDRTRGGSPSIDHDPKTGKLRGVICQGCNTRIAKASKEKLKRIPGARAYLKMKYPPPLPEPSVS